MRLYTREDCEQIGRQTDLYQKVVVCAGKNLMESPPGQLFLYVEKERADYQPEMVDLISLSDGERYLGKREDILGILKPELLPDEAKLHLSQICVHEKKDFDKEEPLFSGYSFLPDGRYSAGVWLYSPQEVMDYVELQKPYQHRVLICDRDDFAVLEVLKGQVIFPDAQAMEEFQKEKSQSQNGGLTMT